MYQPYWEMAENQNQLKFNSNWTLEHWFFFLFFFLKKKKSRFYPNVSNPDFLQTSDTKTFFYNTRKIIVALKNIARRFKRWLHSLVNAIHIDTFGARSEVIIDKLLFAVGDEICVCVVFFFSFQEIMTSSLKPVQVRLCGPLQLKHHKCLPNLFCLLFLFRFDCTKKQNRICTVTQKKKRKKTIVDTLNVLMKSFYLN